MKKYLALFLFVLTTILVSAQGNYQDVVYLKNGSIIRGIIIEQVPNQSIKIETADRNVFVYQMDEIERLTKELRQGGDTRKNTGMKLGYKGIVEWGYQVGIGDYGMNRLKLDIINSEQINPYFSLGLGTGARYFFDAEAVVIPIYVDIRANLINRTVSPYLSLGIGKSFEATNRFEGVGFFFNHTFGVSFKVANKSAINVGIGYEMQRIGFFYYGYGYNMYNIETTEITENVGALNIVVGISF